VYGSVPYRFILTLYGMLPYGVGSGVKRPEEFLMASAARTTRSSRIQTERLEARVAREQKTFFQRAASLRGESLTEFMVASMREAAVKTIEEHELVLSINEQGIFVAMLMNPPKPNAALSEAAEDYFRTVTQ
jgi:uncharacterized protein (DUF1778 family)